LGKFARFRTWFPLREWRIESYLRQFPVQGGTVSLLLMETQLVNRSGIGSLLCCVVNCVLILGLYSAWQSSSPFSDWAGEYLWVVVPYFGTAIATVIAWRSRFFSGWIFASILVFTLTNPTLYFLATLAFGWRKPDSNETAGWALFGLPVMTNFALLGLLVAGVVVRRIEWILQRKGVSERPRRTTIWVVSAVCFCLLVGWNLFVFLSL
jgi:hypothetical protein